MGSAITHILLPDRWLGFGCPLVKREREKEREREREAGYFAIISSWKIMWLYIWTNPIIQRCYVPRLAEIGPVDLAKISNKINVFSHFCFHLPLEKDVAIHLKRLKFPSPRMFCAKIGWNCITNDVNVFSLLNFHYYLPSEKGEALHPSML